MAPSLKQKVSDYNRRLGEWIRAERTRRELSQARLADAIGVSAASIATWELGRSTPASFHENALRAYFTENPAPAAAEVQA